MNKDGVLIIDKPPGITSHDVVSEIKKNLRAKKVGHTGTLDPFATGVLVLGLNQGTKIIPYLDKTEKEYQGVMVLGVGTDTFDVTGKIISEDARDDTKDISTQDVEGVLEKFIGTIKQRPPIFSAKKLNGVRLYKLAREGIPIDIPEKEVNILGLTLLDFSPPEITFRVICSPGTYIRSLAVDIGNALGLSAYLKDLRRTRSGPFTIDDAYPLGEFASLEKRSWERVIGMREAIADIFEVIIDSRDALKVQNGSPLFQRQPLKLTQGSVVKLIHDEKLLALARVEDKKDMGTKIKPFRVFH